MSDYYTSGTLGLAKAKLSTAECQHSIDVAYDANLEAIDGAISSGILAASVTLTSSQLKNLKDSPVELVAAPGAGKALMFHAVMFQLHYIAPAYTAQSLVIFPLAAGTVDHFASTGISDSSASSVSQITVSGFQGYPQSEIEDTAMMVGNNGSAELTTGNSTLTVTVYYSVVTLG